MTISQKS